MDDILFELFGDFEPPHPLTRDMAASRVRTMIDVHTEALAPGIPMPGLESTYYAAQREAAKQATVALPKLREALAVIESG